MTVVTRHRKNDRKTYYVVCVWNGRKVWERVGPDKRAARSRNAQVLREIRDGVFQPKTKRDVTVAAWADEVATLRKDRSNDGDQRILATHVLSRAWFAGMQLDAVRTSDIRRLLDELRATVSAETEKPLSPKYIANIYGMVRGLFARARRRELVVRDPCDGMERREVPRHSRRNRTIYAPDEVRAILRLGGTAPARVFAAIALLTGQREGEVCGARWGDLDWAAEPLASLSVVRQYDGRVLKTEQEEGERTRRVPVHPALAVALRWWQQTGFEVYHLHPPRPEDPIVPAKGGGHHTRSSGYKLWRAVCAAAGVENRSLHSTRHTFITMARRGGAIPDHLERVTHNARGTIVDQYTHLEWDPLCRAVLAIDLGPSVPTAPQGSPMLPDGELTLRLTPKQSAAKRPVEAPGIEPRASDVTTGNDSDPYTAPEHAKRLENSALVHVADAQWDARHQRQGESDGRGREAIDGSGAHVAHREAAGDLRAGSGRLDDRRDRMVESRERPDRDRGQAARSGEVEARRGQGDVGEDARGEAYAVVMRALAAIHGGRPALAVAAP